MNYYFSAPECIYKPVREWILKEREGLFFLMSFANSTKQWKRFYNEGANTMIIDSGAFSAWNSGKTINREQYLRFCKTLPDDVYKINLDVIPRTGSSQEEKLKCIEESFDNYLYLSKHVKNVLPVHHYGEGIEWAKKMLDHTDYICISPANDTHENIKRQYFKWIFQELGLDVKMHVLGYSSIDGCKMFPFYSTDSISYKATHMNGNVMYERSDKTIVRLDISEYAKFIGLKYDSSIGLSAQPELLERGTRETILTLIELFNRIRKTNETKDFTYLISQQTLF